MDRYWDEQEALIGEELARREKAKQSRRVMAKFEGPYSFKDVDGLKTPVYIFKPGGEKKIIGETTVTVDGGMTFDVQLDEEYKDIETASFDVPMRYTYLNLPDLSGIEWGYNCLTAGVHHGRPEAIWNIPLLHAVHIYRRKQLKELVIARIYNDAMQYVNTPSGITGNQIHWTQEWADKIKELAEEKYDRTLQHKVGEISKYYKTSNWRSDVEDVVKRVETDKLNPGYAPLHPHDSINLLCRIIGVSSSIEASQ